jgi:hypothetical protein
MRWRIARIFQNKTKNWQPFQLFESSVIHFINIPVDIFLSAILRPGHYLSMPSEKSIWDSEAGLLCIDETPLEMTPANKRAVDQVYVRRVDFKAATPKPHLEIHRSYKNKRGVKHPTFIRRSTVILMGTGINWSYVFVENYCSAISLLTLTLTDVILSYLSGWYFSRTPSSYWDLGVFLSLSSLCVDFWDLLILITLRGPSEFFVQESKVSLMNFHRSIYQYNDALENATAAKLRSNYKKRPQ